MTGDLMKRRKSYSHRRKIKTIAAPSREEIARDMHMSVQDVDEAMKELIDHGLIKVKGSKLTIYE